MLHLKGHIPANLMILFHSVAFSAKVIVFSKVHDLYCGEPAYMYTDHPVCAMSLLSHLKDNVLCYIRNLGKQSKETP